jgi:hypothetical protein
MGKDLEEGKGAVTHGFVQYSVEAFTLIVFTKSILSAS